MSKRSRITIVALLLIAAVVVASGVVMAKKPKPVPGGCPWADIQCPDVYDPVTCSNGVTYPNGCYAFAACATGCSGGGADI
ncbi:MAG: hypothetical protein OEV00_10910 [Acidobacteriota bacterium]|nr:hypothetical protein [Acidobacteriota bacterium]MDH3785823.1 hypothetical protein [Acidobacteriota bacterium]